MKGKWRECVYIGPTSFLPSQIGRKWENRKSGSHLGPATGSVLILIKYVFCGKWCVRSDICVSIVVKIKCVKSGNISDICDKLNFITNYTHFTTTDTYFINTHTTITIFDTFDEMVPPRDLSISIERVAYGTHMKINFFLSFPPYKPNNNTLISFLFPPLPFYQT